MNNPEIETPSTAPAGLRPSPPEVAWVEAGREVMVVRSGAGAGGPGAAGYPLRLAADVVRAVTRREAVERAIEAAGTAGGYVSRRAVGCSGQTYSRWHRYLGIEPGERITMDMLQRLRDALVAAGATWGGVAAGHAGRGRPDAVRCRSVGRGWVRTGFGRLPPVTPPRHPPNANPIHHNRHIETHPQGRQRGDTLVF